MQILRRRVLTVYTRCMFRVRFITTLFTDMPQTCRCNDSDSVCKYFGCDPVVTPRVNVTACT